MSNETKAKKAFTVNGGRGITVTVFENSGDNGDWLNASLSQPYEDKESKETKFKTMSVSIDDLAHVAYAAEEAFKKCKRAKY